jgi:N-acetylglucosaminyldiphosphoundecaprenol N-acetyl-beta-D-mannosaminyltransferase
MQPRLNILGVHVSAINMTQALETIESWITNQNPHYVCVTSAHGVLECQRDPGLRQIFNHSGMTTPDGMSLVWLLRLHGHRQASRVYGPEIMLSVCRLSLERGWRHFFYGAAPGVAAELAKRLATQFPGLQIAGTYSPPYHPLAAEEDREVIDRINASGGDIIWVGISTPKQEQWMAEHIGKLTAPVLIGVGAAFDFLSGRKKQAPRWMQRSGLEWFFRLATEPQRLWKRYAQYPFFALLVLMQFLGITRYD